MLLAVAFLMFAVLFVSWLVMPDNAEAGEAAQPAEKLGPEAGTMPARA
jgi:hypothetical protein